MINTLSQLRSGKLAGSRRLDLSCGLQHFPEEIYDLADTLEILNLSGNALASLPDELVRFKKLRVIFCSDNQFSHLPEVLGLCQALEMVGFKANQIRHLAAASLPDKLRWLILTDNQLETLPAELGLCTGLQKLMLAGNRLQNLPVEMKACHQLELLRIAANRFESLPNWLLSLPRLSWLAFSGNPVCDALEAAALRKQTMTPIDWNTLTIQKKLGEGASGVIYQADWQQTSEAVRPVAVKLFKGMLTSDGLPRSEKAASMAAGAHSNLIAIKGKISAHPDGVTGLVMALVDASFKNLAAPPSLASCTRDIYTDEINFDLDTVLSMAQAIASVGQHLHSKNIMHGDLYAHNMLWNGSGDCLLGDFGAASFIASGHQAEALERIEVRAYACFLEELLEHCTESSLLLDVLWELQHRCGDEEVMLRPLFDEICQILSGMRRE
ncbi:MAG: leucine-rich repeat-containing protein kinase family protein [Gallionella sp.]